MTFDEFITHSMPRLEREARALRRSLEELGDRHVTSTLEPAAKAAERQGVIDAAHGAARSTLQNISWYANKAARLGRPLADDLDARVAPIRDLVDRILAVTNLDDAEALVADLKN